MNLPDMKLPEVRFPEKRTVVRVLKSDVAIPPYYTKLESPPFETMINDYSAAYGTQTSNAMCALVVTPTPKDAAMPYDDVRYLLGYCRESLGENQGLIEIDTGRTKTGRRYIYTLVKTNLGDDMGVPYPFMSYTLNLNVDYQEFTLSVVGLFQEDGMTGMRDNGGLMFITGVMGMDAVTLMRNGWRKDPYDPDYDKGMPMILSEDRLLDGMFPDHPLSKLRELLNFVTENN